VCFEHHDKSWLFAQRQCITSQTAWVIFTFNLYWIQTDVKMPEWISLPIWTLLRTALWSNATLAVLCIILSKSATTYVMCGWLRHENVIKLTLIPPVLIKKELGNIRCSIIHTQLRGAGSQCTNLHSLLMD